MAISSAPVGGIRCALAAIMAVAAVVCLAGIRPSNAQVYQPANISDAMDAALYLTQFKAGLQSAGLLDEVSSPDFNGTVFAPTDLAVEQWLNTTNMVLSQAAADNATFTRIMGMHIAPGMKYFPLVSLRQGLEIPTQSGLPLTVDKSTPGLVHLYAEPMVTGTTNYATILQYQEIRGGKAVLYVVDRVLLPPKA